MVVHTVTVMHTVSPVHNVWELYCSHWSYLFAVHVFVVYAVKLVWMPRALTFVLLRRRRWAGRNGVGHWRLVRMSRLSLPVMMMGRPCIINIYIGATPVC